MIAEAIGAPCAYIFYFIMYTWNIQFSFKNFKNFSNIRRIFDWNLHNRRSVKDEVREGRPKTAIVPDNIDALSELIMQYRHVTYRSIEISWGIYSTSLLFVGYCNILKIIIILFFLESIKVLGEGGLL